MPKASHSEYGEKRINRGYTLTPTAAKMLAEKAASHGISASDFIEKIARDEIPSSIPREPKTGDLAVAAIEEEMATVQEKVRALEEKVNALMLVLQQKV